MLCTPKSNKAFGGFIFTPITVTGLFSLLNLYPVYFYCSILQPEIKQSTHEKNHLASFTIFYLLPFFFAG
jgi:hypothetical protein